MLRFWSACACAALDLRSLSLFRPETQKRRKRTHSVPGGALLANLQRNSYHSPIKDIAIMKMLLILFAVLFCFAATAMAAENGTVATKKGKLRHVVAFKFKDTASKEDIQKIVEAFGALKKKIPAVLSYEWGTNNSPENRNKGCTHAFTLTFNSEKDRDAYLVDPAHKEFGKLVGPVLADVFVIDYWIQN
jgi:hypothetical protein